MKDPWDNEPLRPPSLIRKTLDQVALPMGFVLVLISLMLLAAANVALCIIGAEYLGDTRGTTLSYALLFIFISIFVWWFGLAMLITYLKDIDVWDKIEW